MATAGPPSATAAPAPSLFAHDLPRSRRLRKRREFVRVQSGAVRVSTPHALWLLAARDEGAAPPRLGIVASRKVGNAVARNRIKRLLREAFRLRPELFASGVDFVAIARSGADQLRLADVLDQLESVRKLLAKRALQACANARPSPS